MSLVTTLRHFEGDSLCVVINHEACILEAEFSGAAFSSSLGWPQEPVLGGPFSLIHQQHAIDKDRITEGIRQVCQCKNDHFRYRFNLHDHHKTLILEYELVAKASTIDQNRIEIVYEKLREYHLVDPANAGRVALYRKVFQHAPFGIVYQNTAGMVEFANPLCMELLEVNEDTFRNLTRKNMPWELFDERGKPIDHHELPHLTVLETQRAQEGTVIGFIRNDGDKCWIEIDAQPVFDDDEAGFTGVLSTFTDVTQDRKARDVLAVQSERAQIAIENAEMGVWEWYPYEKVMIWDEKLFELCGCTKFQTKENFKEWEKSIHPEDLPRLKVEGENMLLKGKQKSMDYRVCLPDGSIRHLRSHARPLLDCEGKYYRVVGVTRDVSNEVIAERKLWDLAFTDTLTGVYSRAGLNYRLSRSVVRCMRDGRKCAVLMMGLIRFKDINENYGLNVGDKVLCEVARRAQSLIKQDDTVARVGGDEFTLVLESAHNDADIAEFITHFRSQVLSNFHMADGQFVNIDAAIGVSIFPQDGEDLSSLQNHAGLAMQRDSLSEKPGFMRYINSMSEQVSRRFSLQYQLVAALKQEEFQLYYQPIIDLHDDKVIACEALIRWRDGDGSFVSPMEFIPVVEESGLIYELGKWINVTAIKQWKLWQQLVPELKYISVNVSPRQLEHPDFLEDLMAAVHEHKIAPNNLQLEITEGTFLQESENADGTLQKLAQSGFRLAIDDFGTGYSSLAYLKRFAVDVIKIDRSFIKDIETDSSDRDIVAAILAMNKKLGFMTLVEGVETDQQNHIVQSLGCDSAQGYLYGRPTFADEFAETYISKIIKH